MSDVDLAVAAIRSGDPVVLPFDTVYGLVAKHVKDERLRQAGRPGLP